MKTTTLAVRSNLPYLEKEQVFSSSRNEIKSSKDNLWCMAGWVRGLTSKSLGEEDSAEGCVLGQAQHWYGGENWGVGHGPTSRLGHQQCWQELSGKP